MTIKLRYTSIDRSRTTRTFETLEGAQKWAQSWVGSSCDIGSSYAISFDGVGKIEVVSGTTLRELFPNSFSLADPRDAEQEAAAALWDQDYGYADHEQEDREYEANLHADYVREAYAGLGDDPEGIAIEQEELLAEERERTCDDIEIRGAVFGRCWTGSYPETGDIPF
jgi:hypothetical protein